MVKEGWFEPSVLWGAVVGASGSQKSPALDAAIAPLHLRQAQAYRDYDLLVVEYQEARQRGEEEIRLPPSGPGRLLVLDTTVEGLIPLLKENGRGLLLVREEISGWLGSFDRYARGSVSDEASWLTMHGARSLCVDRKTADHRTIHVSRAAVSVVGTIQPGVLRKAIGTLRRESGLAARFLMVYPPRYRRRWNDVELDPQLQQQYADVLDRLLALEPDSEENGAPVPAVVRLDPEARQLFIAFFERNVDEAWAMEEDMEAAYSKLEGGAVRFALVLAMIRGESIISAESMQAAIELIDWFKQEANRVYRMFSESEADRYQRELLEWIARKGGEVTVREVQQGHRRFKSADQAEAALDDLVKLGKVERQLVQTRTRPRYAFRLKSMSTSTHLSETSDSAESVDVDAVDSSMSMPIADHARTAADASPWSSGDHPPGEPTTVGPSKRPLRSVSRPAASEGHTVRPSNIIEKTA